MAADRVLVEMEEELQATPVRGEAHRVRMAAGYRQLPLDANCYIHIDRMVGDVGGGVRGLLGHLIEMDVLNSVGTHIEIKLYRGDGLVLLVDGQEVYKWQKLDGGTSTVRKPARRVTRRGRKIVGPKAPISKEATDDDFEFE